MVEIGSAQLDVALSALSDQLTLAGVRTHLVVIGGSGLIAIDAVSRSTRDVDVVALEEDGVLVSAEPLPTPVAEATAVELREAALWARTHNMPAPFDDAIAQALRDLGFQDDGRRA
jgi:hypothetical protein